ncbi:MAG TPA: hypothetical protein VIO61_06370 [Anaerolineaceae bacterium]
MRTISLVSLVLLALLGLFVPVFSIDHSVILVRGEYTVQTGETLQGYSLILYVNANLYEGCQVAGNVHVYYGNHAVAGEVNRQAASPQLGASINTTGFRCSLPKFLSLLQVNS